MLSTVNCSMCADGAIGGELNLSRELRGDEGHWVAVSAETHRLCPDCYRFCIDVLASAAAGNPGNARVFGMPMTDASAQGLEPRCEACSAQLAGKRFVIDAVPTPQRVTHRYAPFTLRRNHLCRQCFTWWRMLIRDSASLRGRGARQSEGPIGSWIVMGLVDVAIASLDERDAQLVSAVVEASNGQVLSFEQLFWERDPGKVALFVHAGRRDRATSFVRSLPAWLRGDVVVVTQPDWTEDALAAMRCGAGELLVSPLSPQQVIGAMERVRNVAHRPAKDPGTGLPLFSMGPTSAAERRPHSVVVRDLPATEFGLGVVHLRRFTRGYDQVGVTREGELCALVECPEADLPAVQRRMSLVFAGLGKIDTHPGGGAFALSAAG